MKETRTFSVTKIKTKLFPVFVFFLFAIVSKNNIYFSRSFALIIQDNFKSITTNLTAYSVTQIRQESYKNIYRKTLCFYIYNIKRQFYKRGRCIKNSPTFLCTTILTN